jgi:hypothetical protein
MIAAQQHVKLKIWMLSGSDRFKASAKINGRNGGQ